MAAPRAPALSAEISRLETTLIASFLHPNPAGAERYANSIVTVYQRHQKLSVKDATHGMVDGRGALSLSSTLRRNGLDPARGLRQLALVAYVESVVIELDQFSADLSIKIVQLVLGADVTFTFVPFHMPGGTPQNVLLAFDTGVIYLSQITELTVTIVDSRGQDEQGGDVPDPVTFTQAVLYLHGCEVFRGNRADGNVTRTLIPVTPLCDSRSATICTHDRNYYPVSIISIVVERILGRSEHYPIPARRSIPGCASCCSRPVPVAPGIVTRPTRCCTLLRVRAWSSPEAACVRRSGPATRVTTAPGEWHWHGAAPRYLHGPPRRHRRHDRMVT